MPSAVPGAEPQSGIRVAANIFMIARRFEDLEAWQLANEVKKRVYALLDISKARKDRKFCEQITESAASAPANLSEGFGYYRHPEFARHTRVAKSSLMETQNHLGDGVDRGFWTDAQARPICELADRAIGKCVRLLAHLETTEAPGTINPPKRRKGTTFPKRKA
ncbi:MAG TPA: four helix bundle protein [Vicinamibacterales bacterium]|nr:four helix bundle protein [Vicinamibacterales bacterium]